MLICLVFEKFMYYLLLEDLVLNFSMVDVNDKFFMVRCWRFFELGNFIGYVGGSCNIWSMVY